MKLNIYKTIRIILGILFFIPILSIFIDFKHLTSDATKSFFTEIQFIPSLLNFIQNPLNSFLIIALLLIVTLIFGRIYCSSVCPLGILQDIILYFQKKFNKKKKLNYSKPVNKVRYSILLFTFLGIFLGQNIVLNLLDPYSLFGKIAASIFRPMALIFNNILSYLFLFFDSYLLHSINIYYAIPLLIFSILVFGFIIFLVLKKGRLYCNTICPVGTFLGLISRYSFIKIKINDSKCNECKLCEKKCRATCIDSEKRQIDYSRCINCYDCISVCSTRAIEYSLISFNATKNNILEKEINQNKRTFITTMITGAIANTILSRANEISTSTYKTTIKEERNNLVTPPGSLYLTNYNTLCTACNLCVTACPTDVLQPTFIDYGLEYIFQPKLDFHKGFCNYECTTCLDICPTNAITKIPLEQKKLTQIGVAQFIRENCVVITDGTDCGACNEHCPTKAVIMKPEGNLFVPEVIESLCLGCGACEYACPTKPYRAIYVEGNIIHKTLEPHIEDKPQRIETPEEFPF